MHRMFLPVVLDKKAICFLAIIAIRPKLWQFRLVHVTQVRERIFFENIIAWKCILSYIMRIEICSVAECRDTSELSCQG